MRHLAAVTGAGALLLLAGCTSAEPDDAGGATTTPPPSTSTAAGTPTGSSTPAPPVTLPESCGALLPLTELDAALGTGLPGSVSYVRGQPIPDIGRTDRITCGFGVTLPPSGTTAPPPLLEVSVSSYADAPAAAARIDVTRTDRQTAGDRVDQVTVAGLPAVALTGVTGTTLVFAEGTWTYSLTLLRAVVADDQTVARLVAVAEAVRAQLA